MRKKTQESIAFGHRLREAIKASGLTKREFCDKSETSLGALNGYENGEIFPSLFKVLDFTAAIGCNFEWLATGHGSMKGDDKTIVEHVFEVNEEALAEAMTELEATLKDNSKTWLQKSRILVKYYKYVMEVRATEEEHTQAAG